MKKGAYGTYVSVTIIRRTISPTNNYSMEHSSRHEAKIRTVSETTPRLLQDSIIN